MSPIADDVEAREEIAATAANAIRSSARVGLARTRAAQEGYEMDMSSFTGSNFIRIDDVRDGPIQGKITEVELGTYGRPVLSFDDGSRLTLNATNTRVLVKALGPDSGDWIGHVVECFAGATEYRGEARDSVLVRLAAEPKPEPEPVKLDDEIPF